MNKKIIINGRSVYGMSNYGIMGVINMKCENECNHYNCKEEKKFDKWLKSKIEWIGNEAD